MGFQGVWAWECHDILQELDKVAGPDKVVIPFDMAVVVVEFGKVSIVVVVVVAQAERCIQFLLFCVVGCVGPLPGGCQKIASQILTQNHQSYRQAVH